MSINATTGNNLPWLNRTVVVKSWQDPLTAPLATGDSRIILSTVDPLFCRCEALAQELLLPPPKPAATVVPVLVATRRKSRKCRRGAGRLPEAV